MSRRGRLARAIVPAIVVGVVVVASIGPALALTPPPPPAAYYGDLTVNGQPAPAGTVVTARIDGEERGRLVTERSGAYGGAGAFDPKLQVDGTSDDDGATVVLYVGGQRAGTTTWRSADVRQVDLEVSSDPGESTTTPEPPATPSPTPISTVTPVPSATPFPTPTATATPSPGGGGAGDGGSGGAAPTDTPAGPAPGTPGNGDSNATEDGPPVTTPTLDISLDDDGHLRVTVSGARPGDTIEVPVGRGPGENGVTLERLQITTRSEAPFTLDVATSAGPPDGAPPFDVKGAAAPLGYVRVDHSIPDRDIGSIGFRVRVARERLDALGHAPESISLYRYHDGRWRTTRVTSVVEEGDTVVYDMVSPGLSTFALAARTTPPVSVVESTLLADRMTAGNLGGVTVVVENPSDALAETTLTLRVDGTAVAGRTVTVPADGRAETTLTYRFDTPGEYTLTVGNVSVGTVVVSGSTPTATLASQSTTTPDDPPVTDATWGGGPGFGVVSMLAAVLAATLWMRRRNSG